MAAVERTQVAPRTTLNQAEWTCFIGWLEGARNFMPFVKIAKKLRVPRYLFARIKAGYKVVPSALLQFVAETHGVTTGTVLNVQHTGYVPKNQGHTKVKPLTEPTKPTETTAVEKQTITAISILTDCLLITPEHKNILEYLEELLKLNRDGSAYSDNLFFVLYEAVPRWLQEGRKLSDFVEVAKGIVEAKEYREKQNGNKHSAAAT